ncbi:MAG: glycosyltransferase family 2 protein [Holophagales bacterium]|nr:glycosyltransferase family 2 protein [Holophagales bacterium]
MNASASDRISLFFPVYRDERTIERVAAKAHRVLAELTSDYEIIVVNDGSPDRAGEIADELARQSPRVRVIHHGENLGYGKALRTGLEAARYEWIAFTDGDDEYEVDDLRKLWRLREHYDLILTFRYAKEVRERADLHLVRLQQPPPVGLPDALPRHQLRPAPRPEGGGRRAPAPFDQPFHRCGDRDQDDAQGVPRRGSGYPDVPAGVRPRILDEPREHPRHAARHAPRLPGSLLARVRPSPEPLTGSGRRGPRASDPDARLSACF